MIPRLLEPHLRRLAGSMPIVTVNGPRQSGKTTLCRIAFPEKPYVTLESPDVRNEAVRDARAFLARYPEGAILDEVQRAPDLLSYLQGVVDERRLNGMYILTGSAHFNMLRTISQSLAGRTAILDLLPFAMPELAETSFSKQAIGEWLYRGTYPRLYDQPLVPHEMYRDYVRTYVERDVLGLLRVQDLEQFDIFLRLCASRSGQIINYTSIGNDCGLNHATARQWLSVLEASYIIHFVRPHFRNFGKRLVKSPKMYFWDVGLMAHLLGIQSPEQAMIHPLRGAMFETLAISELLKARANAVMPPNAYFFADNAGHELDAILEHALHLVPVEIKSAQTFAEDLTKALRYYVKLNAEAASRATLIYAGDSEFTHKGVKVVSFRNAYQVNV